MAKNEAKKKTKIGDIIVNILLVLSLCVLGCAIYIAYQFKENPQDAFLFGYKPVYILTGSMEPTLREKGVAIVKKATYDEVDVDDIIMYQVEDKTITHRIISKDAEGIRTKGDNNDVQDAYTLTDENVRAKVVLILNFTADIVNDIQAGPKGYVKWIGFPIFVLVVIFVTPKIIKKILASDSDDENDKKKKVKKIDNKGPKTS